MIRLAIMFLLLQESISRCNWEFLQDITPLADVANTTTTSRVRLAFSPNGNYLGVWTDGDRKIRILDKTNNTWMRRFKDTVTSSSGTMVLANDGTIVTDKDTGGIISPYDRTQAHQYARFEPIVMTENVSFSVSANGNLLAVGSEMYDLSNRDVFPRQAPLLGLDVTKAVVANKTVTSLSGGGKKFFAVDNDDPAASVVQVYHLPNKTDKWVAFSQLDVPSYLADVSRISTSAGGHLVVLQSSDNVIALFQRQNNSREWKLVNPDIATEGITASQVQVGPHFLLLIQRDSDRPAVFRMVGDTWSFHEEATVGLRDQVMTADGQFVAVASKGVDLSIRLYRIGCPTVQPTRSPTQLPTAMPSTASPTMLPSTASPTTAPFTILPTRVPTSILPTRSPSRPPSQAVVVTATICDLEWSIAFHDLDRQPLSPTYLGVWESITEQAMAAYYESQDELVVENFRTVLTAKDQWSDGQGDLVIRYDQRVTYTIFAGAQEPIVHQPLHYALLPMTKKHQKELFPRNWQTAIAAFDTVVIPLVTEPYVTNITRTEFGDIKSPLVSASTTSRSQTFLIVVLVLLGTVGALTSCVLVWYCCDRGAVCALKKRRTEVNFPVESVFAASIDHVMASPMEVSERESPIPRETPASDEVLPVFKDQVTTMPLASAVPMTSAQDPPGSPPPVFIDPSGSSRPPGDDNRSYGSSQHPEDTAVAADMSLAQPQLSIKSPNLDDTEALKQLPNLWKPPHSKSYSFAPVADDKEPPSIQLPNALRRTLHPVEENYCTVKTL